MHTQSGAPVEDLLSHAAHLLPAQGPIGVFIHHNTLHAFQHQPFEDAVTAAAATFGAEPYMLESAYRRSFEAGRIRPEDLDRVLKGEGNAVELRGVLLMPGLRAFRPETIRWEIEESGLTDRFRADLPEGARAALAGESPRELFELWLERTPAAPPEATFARRPREGVLHLTGIDTDDAVNPLLIKLTGGFLDQGLAYWPMPGRESGFWKSAVALLACTGVVESEFSRLSHWVRRWQPFEAVEIIEAAMDLLRVEDRQAFLQAELLALPGWAGLMHQLEADPSLAPHERVPAKLIDFVAVRLLLTVAATDRALDRIDAWKTAIGSDGSGSEEARLAIAARWFDASQLMGLGAKTLGRWSAKQLDEFRSAVDAFGEWERRRVWHVAYEWRHARQILVPLRQHACAEPIPLPARLAAQVFFCIDEREESIRRHLEELDPEIETFGAAGFFGVAMNYTGLDDAHGASLCPVVVKPQHAVREQPVAGEESTHGRRMKLRRAWSRIARHWFVSSRTLVRGWLGTTALGLFSLFPLAARVLSPRRYAKLMAWLNESVLPEPRTELTFMRGSEAGHHALGLMSGFTVAEKVDCVASVLGPAGLRKGMARLVVVLGHGSTSLNNPHESAYDCGACGGRRGGPNARIFAAMANHAGVRQGLRERGISIPEDTWFVGGQHDTCNDDIDLYDLEDVPASHRGDLERVRASFDAARTANAHERTRRFEAASGSRQALDGLRHVQERSEHLAEPRPETGHSTNSMCFVGRRALTRGLFLDRRAFLVSYDATQDPDNGNLGRVLDAVIPVCGGINLEYYFSFIDNERYGCGTKLPHNITCLVSVMNGYESDLRTGLPWQMVEIHEPVRILFVVETTPDRVLSTIRANPLLWEFLDNRWIRLATVDPEDATVIHYYNGGGQWERIEGDDERLARASSSVDWYHGKLEHLPMARIAA